MHPHRVIASVECGRFRALEFVQPPNLTIAPHEHAEATLLFVLNGRVTDRFGSREYTVAPGRLLFRPPGERHSHAYSGSETRCIAVTVEERVAVEMAGLGLLFGTVSEATSRSFEHALAREISCNDALRPLAIECRLLDFLVGIARRQARSTFQGGRPPAWVLDVRDRLEDESPGTLPSLAVLAGQAGVHSGHLARSFRVHFGVSIGRYVRERRIRWAASELRASDLPIVEVALMAGFYDQSHFTREFHRVTGTTPAEWRRSGLPRARMLRSS